MVKNYSRADAGKDAQEPLRPEILKKIVNYIVNNVVDVDF